MIAIGCPEMSVITNQRCVTSQNGEDLKKAYVRQKRRNEFGLCDRINQHTEKNGRISVSSCTKISEKASVLL